MASLIDKYYRAGKILPIAYYTGSVLRELVPYHILKAERKRLIAKWQDRPDAEYIRDRVDTYCRLEAPFTLPADATVAIGDIRTGRYLSRYVFDVRRTLRYFPADSRVAFLDGDIRENPAVPTLLKCRRLNGRREENGVVLNLDRIRHWLRPKDNIPFAKKTPKLFFRGDIYGKPARISFFEQWAGNPMFDLGDTCTHHPSRWHAEFVTVPRHFSYQYILALEGYDMASSLQWIMASGCVPVMPRPTVEGWLMHSRLEPGRHYVEISPDFSDVGERMSYYLDHPAEGAEIAGESRRWAEQFQDRGRENLIALLTVDKYLSLKEN